MPITWSPENKFKLMLAIMQVKGPSPPDWCQVANLLGPGVTIEACKQQYKGIKKIAGSELQLDTATVTPATTPRKRKTKMADETNGDLDEEPQPSPSKKKNTGGTALKAVKTEDTGDVNSGLSGNSEEDETAV